MHNEEVDVSTAQPILLTDDPQNLTVTSGLGIDVTAPEQVIEITQSGMFSFYENGASGDGYMSNQGPNTTKFGGFAADRNFVRTHLSWIETNVPNYHRMTRVYRAKSNDFSLAECVGDSETQTFTDTVEPGVDYFYWLVGETYAGKQTEPSLGLSVAATEDSNFLLDLLGLSELVGDLSTLEDRLNSSYLGAYLNLEDLAAQNLASNIKLINDSIATVTANMVQIEQRLGLESVNALALLQEQLTIAVDESNALIERVNTLTAQVTTETEERLAQITRLELAQVTVDSALTQARDELNASIANERSLREASVVAERTARVNAVEVVASSVESLNTTFQTEMAITNAAIDSERIARTTAQAATVQQITDISTGFDTARSELDSRITQEMLSQSTATEAIASSLVALDTKVTTDLARVEANVSDELTSYSDELGSIANQVLTLDASFQGLSGTLSQTNALIAEESTTRANEFEALARRTTNLEASFENLEGGSGGIAQSVFDEEVATRASEDEALSSRITELDTKFTDKDSTTNARITNEVKTLSDADAALSTRTSTLEASYEELDNDAIRALVTAETTARTTKDQALTKDINDLSTQMETDIGTAKAEANEYTLSVVGYCVVGDGISDHTTQESCEINGGTWAQLPLSQAIDKVSVTVTKPDGTVSTGTVGSQFTAISDELGNVITEAELAVSASESAEQSRQAAVTAKTDAEGSASAALTSENTAKGHADRAQTEANAAVSANTSASGHANAALSAKTAAESAQSAAVQAKTDAQGYAEAALTSKSEAEAQANAAIQARTKADESAELVSRVSLVQGIIMDFWEGSVGVGLADNYAGATTKFTLTSDTEGKAALRIRMVDAEGGGTIAFNGEVIDTGFRGEDNEVKWYEYVVDVQFGDNEVALWRTSSDGISVNRIELRGGDQDTKFSEVEERLNATENEAFYSLKVASNGKVAGFGLTANPDGTSILFNAENIGFTNNTNDDVFPFTVRDNTVYINKARMVTLEANSIINVESVNTTEKKAQLGNTLVEGSFNLAQDGQIRWKDLDPTFRDNLVTIDPNAEVLGGTRTITAQPTNGQPLTLWIAQSGNSNNPPLKSGGASHTLQVSAYGGLGFGGRVGTPQDAPKATVTAWRRKVGQSAELIETYTFIGLEHAEAEANPPFYWTSISETYEYTVNLPQSGSSYEYYIEITSVSGAWGTSGQISAALQEPISSSGGLVANTSWDKVTNKPVTATRWPTPAEIGALASNSDIYVTKEKPWLTLDSASYGSNNVEQAAGVSIGESGQGAAALHLTYTGDGRGWIGMGTVTNAIPQHVAMEFYYTNNIVIFKNTPRVNGSLVYHEGHKPSWGEVDGKPVTATRWPTWDEISDRPRQPIIANTIARSVLQNSSTLESGFYSTSEGLPNPTNSGTEESSWWHVLNFKHKDNNGYGAQLALELSSGTDAKLQFRTSGSNSNGDSWTNWYKVYSEQHKPTWSEVTGKPTTFTPSAHNHSASNITSGTLSDARLPQTLTYKKFQKDAHTSGANTTHVELYSPEGSSSGEVSLRFHQGGRFYYQLRARADGMHVTGGANNTLAKLHADFRGDLRGDVTSGIVKLDGNSTGLEVLTGSAGGWARGISVLNGSNARIGGAGFLGGNNYVTRFAIGYASSWWDDYKFAVSSSSMNVKVASNFDEKVIIKAGGTIAGTSAGFNNGWLQVGTSSDGWTIDPNEIYCSGSGNIGTFSGDLNLSPAAMVKIKGGVRLDNASAGILQIDSPSGWVRVGANNTGYAHFYTDRPHFYMNKNLHVDGFIKVYNRQSQFTGDGNHALIGATDSYFTRISNNGDIARKNSGWANNATEQKIIRNSWVGSIGDYMQLQPSGNTTTNGTLVIGSNGFAVGRHDLGGAEADVRVPFSDTWLSVNTTDFWLSGKRVIRHSDSWLRLNEDKSFSSGIYCGGSTLRTDGTLQVGSSGSSLNATTGQIDLKSTTRVHGRLHLKEIVTQDGNFTTIGSGELGNYLYNHASSTYGAGHEMVHLGAEGGVMAWASPDNMSSGAAGMKNVHLIDSSGNTQLNKLTVYDGTTNENSIDIRSGSEICRLFWRSSDDNFGFYINNSTRLRWTGNNNRWTASGEMWAVDFVATSDRRVKDKLESIDSALAKLDVIEGFTYDHLKLNERKAGVIAQDVQKVLPEAVTESDDGTLNVSALGVIGLLVNAVKELSAQVQELKHG